VLGQALVGKTTARLNRECGVLRITDEDAQCVLESGAKCECAQMADAGWAVLAEVKASSLVGSVADTPVSASRCRMLVGSNAFLKMKMPNACRTDTLLSAPL